MADELYRWLDRETAERLLRGESLEAVDTADRDQAERLAKTLESLTVEPPPSSAELPGEAAALAAFRAARAGRDDVAVPVGHRSRSGASRAADDGLVRIGAPAPAARRPRWGRPLRLALAATLAVGMVGGVAVAAGTGVLPEPFGDEEPARPAATVSAPAPQERPLVSPSPESTGPDRHTPDGTSKAPAGPGATQDTAPSGGPTGDRESADEERDGSSGGWWKDFASSCRDIRDGKELSHDRRRDLVSAAGGSQRVPEYCKKALKLVAENGETGENGKSAENERDKERGSVPGAGRGEDDDDSGDQGGEGPARNLVGNSGNSGNSKQRR